MSDKKTTYREHTDMENTLKLRQVLATLPPFCKDYFRAIDTTTTAKTRISYAYDIRIFFQFLLDENPAFKDHAMTDFTVDVLDQIKAVDLEEYQEYLKLYQLLTPIIMLLLHAKRVSSILPESLEMISLTFQLLLKTK